MHIVSDTHQMHVCQPRPAIVLDSMRWRILQLESWLQRNNLLLITRWLSISLGLLWLGRCLDTCNASVDRSADNRGAGAAASAGGFMVLRIKHVTDLFRSIRYRLICSMR